MTYAKRRPGKSHRGDVDDQHRAGEVSSESSRVACLPGVVPGRRVRSPRALRVLSGASWLPLPEVVAMSVHDLTLGEVDGQGAVFVLPVVSEADSPRAREGIVRRRLVALSGACPCGARLTLAMPNRAIDSYGQGGPR